MEKFKFTKDDNTDRDFPDAFEVLDMEFKINGEYVCVDPCGGEGGKHLLGDQYIYVDVNGNDDIFDEQGDNRTGTQNDPFATIQRAIEYANTFVTLGGNIYIVISAGTFYIDNTVSIDHPNKIIFRGNDYFVSSIHFSDNTTSNFLYFWFGGNALFGGGGDDLSNPLYSIESIIINIGSTSVYFADLNERRRTYSACSDGTIGLWIGGYWSGGSIDKTIFAINVDATNFGVPIINTMAHSSCSDGVKGFTIGAGVSSNYDVLLRKEIDYSVFKIEASSSFYADLTKPIVLSGSVSNNSESLVFGGSGSYFPSSDLIWDEVEKFYTYSFTNSTVVSNLSIKRQYIGTCEDRTIGLSAGGFASFGSIFHKIIEKFYIDITSSYINFGDLIEPERTYGSCSDGVTGIFTCIGGLFRVEKITIVINSNSTNYGDLLSIDRRESTGCSGN